MSVIGRAICAWRELFGMKPAHNLRRPRKMELFNLIELRQAGITNNFRVCDRCGYTVPVRARKRKQAQGAE